MRKPMKARPQLESLESLSLLSGAAAALHHDGHAEVATTTPVTGATLTLSGTEHGTFVAHKTSTGTTYDVTAVGNLTPIGFTAATGNLHVLSGISSGPPNGTLHLMTRHGTLTLQIPESVIIPVGLPTATSSNEIVDTFTITKGTGAYKGDTGTGVVEFTLNGLNSSKARFRVGRVNITFTSLLPPTSTTTTS